jgi:hypothetical protein
MTKIQKADCEVTPRLKSSDCQHLDNIFDTFIMVSTPALRRNSIFNRLRKFESWHKNCLLAGAGGRL